jgi:hypothetical protein
MFVYYGTLAHFMHQGPYSNGSPHRYIYIYIGGHRPLEVVYSIVFNGET